MKYFVACGDHEIEVEVDESLGRRRLRVNGKPYELSYQEIDSLGQVAVQQGGLAYALSIEGGTDQVRVTLAGHAYALTLEDERERAAHAAEKAVGKGLGPLKSVMPGSVVGLLVQEGDEVQEGAPLLVLEAMKMQNEIIAPATGVVQSIAVTPGQAVQAGDVLLILA